MKSIKSKIQVSMLSVVLVGSVLIGVITALLNARGIDDVMTKTWARHTDGRRRCGVENGELLDGAPGSRCL